MSGWLNDGGPRAAGSPAVSDAGQSQLWKFSLTVYGAPGVQEECLHLQERHGVDVNVLLFCAYVGAVHGALPSDSDVRAAAAAAGEWNRAIVGSLREARRGLKPFAADPAGPAAVLRKVVKEAELEAERIEQMMLETWSADRIKTWPRTQPETAVVASIAALLKTHDVAVGHPDPTSNLVAAALACARRADA
jgi:uncharacterized protein (TIGR02444 family)